MPPRQRKPRSTKKTKPSFEVVRGAYEETQTGWVFKSDAEPAVGERPEAAPVWRPAEPPVVPQSHYASESYRLATSPAEWIEAGLLLMTLPVAFTTAMMVAPVMWMLGSRRR